MVTFGFIFASICVLICSGLMTAYSNANKIYLNLESKKHETNNHYLKIVTEQPRLFIGALKVGNSIFITLLSLLFFTTFLDTYELDDSWKVVVFLMLLYIIAKFIPQTFVKPFANEIILAAKPFIQLILKLFGSIAQFFVSISEKSLEKKYPYAKDTEFNLLSTGDLGSYISQQIQASSQQEQLENEFEILKNALSFPKVKVKEIMTPRNEFEFVSEEAEIEDIRKKFVDTGFSKILISNGTNEHFVGYLHTYDLLQLQQPIDDFIRPFVYVYDDLLIKDLLNTLTLRKKSIALVKNQENDIIGLVTLEDVIEELFGEITDEHDDTLIAKQISETEFIFSASLELDDIQEKFDIHLPQSDEYHTLGGYIFHQLKRQPKVKEVITIKPFKIKILAATNTRIKTVSLSIIK
ncbi:MAG: hemolysin family protein [Myroides sp.]|nr:hemolysin family protein [Myroides sp.]